MRNSFIALAVAASVALATPGLASTITSQTLSGQTSGNATVFQIDLSTIGLAGLESITLTDGGDPSVNGSNSAFSGLDIDAIWISSVNCSDVACLSAATASADLDYLGASFSAGGLLNGGSLFGTSAGAIDHSVATLATLDAAFSPAVSGFFSLGLTGSLTIELVQMLNLTVGPYYLYIAEVGGGGAEFSLDVLSFQGAYVLDQLEKDILVNPIPGALPLMVTALMGYGFIGFRRKRKQADI